MSFSAHAWCFSLYGQDNNLLNRVMGQKDTTMKNSIAEKDSGAESGPSHEDLIVAIAKSADKQAFIQLFEYFAPRVKSFLMRGNTNPDLADELAQETMMAVWHKAGSFKPEQAKASTWIFTIARNKRIDAFRKMKRPEPDIDNFSIEDENAARPDDNLDAMKNARALADAIKNLPEEQSILIRKSFFEEKTHSDIADELDLPLGTVKSRIRLALEKLRYHIGDMEL